MKILSKIIKGALLTAFAVSLFCVNTNFQSQATSFKLQATNTQVQAESYFVNTVFAQTPEEKAADEAALKKIGLPELTAEEKAKAAKLATQRDLLFEDSTVKVAPKAKDGPPKKETLDQIAKASSYMNKLFNPFIFFFTSQIGSFLNNDFIFGGKFGEMLHTIWIISRNIVNIVFVLILLFMAVRHIFTDGEGSELKKALPKFVIMLVAINFSWLASRVILDAANVATNVVFAIPKGVQGVVGENKSKDKAKECKLIDKYDDEFSAGANGAGYKTNSACQPTQAWMPIGAKHTQYGYEEDCSAGKTGKDTPIAKNYDKSYDNKKKPIAGKPLAGVATICFKTIDPGQFSRSNAAYHLTYSMMRVQNLGRAQADIGIEDLSMGIMFSLLIQIVYLVTFGCLFFALVIRMAALWLFVAFSPFVVLMMYLTKDFGLSGEGTDQLTIGEFAKWAFAPAKVALVWTIGFIMITTGQTATEQVFVKLNDAGVITEKVFNTGSLFLGMNSLKEFIWLFMTIGIIWVGTFAVFSKLGIVSSITDKVKDVGTGIARRVGEAPFKFPYIPMVDPNNKGKISWTSPSKLSPLNAYDTWIQKTTGQIPDAKIDEAGQAMKAKKDTQPHTDLAAGKVENPAEAISKLTGGKLSAADIKGMNETKLHAFLNSGGIEDKAKRQTIIDKIKSSPTATKPAETKPAATSIAPEIKKGVTEALSHAEVKAVLKDGAIKLKPNETHAVAMQRIQKLAEESLKDKKAANLKEEDYHRAVLAAKKTYEGS